MGNDSPDVLNTIKEKKMTDKDQIQPIITAYLSGKATAEERRKLDDWVKQSPDNDRYYPGNA